MRKLATDIPQQQDPFDALNELALEELQTAANVLAFLMEILRARIAELGGE